MGISTRAGEVGILLGALCACILATATSVLLPFRPASRQGREVEKPINEENAMAGFFQRFGFPAVTIVFIIFVFCPDLHTIAQYIIAAPGFSPGWDSNNLTYWSYLLGKGYIPYRDFWYPYSGRYILGLPLPFGALLMWCYQTVLYSVLFYSLYRITNRRFWTSFLAILVAMIGELTGMFFPNGDRYLLSVAVFLSYLAVDRQCQRCSPRLAVFWLMWAMSFFFEPAQLGYAGGAIAAIVILDGLQECWRSRSCSEWVHRLGREFAVPLAATALISVWFAEKGQFTGIANLYLRAADSAAYGAVPTDLSWLKHLRLGPVMTQLTQYPSAVLFGPPIS